MMNINWDDFKVDLEVRQDFKKTDKSLEDIVILAEEINKLSTIKLNGIDYNIREVRVSEKRYEYYTLIIMLITDNVFRISGGE